MLTLDMLFAVLQGLPADHLQHLDRAWYLLAYRIEMALNGGQDPAAALYTAVCDSSEWERSVYLRAYEHEEPVLALPDLTQRQKEALIALRYAGSCSLTQITRVLAQDRSNTRRRLDFLVEKGYAFKYFGREGACYMAVTTPIPDGTRSRALEIMQSFKQALFDYREQKNDRDAQSSAPRRRNPKAAAKKAGTSVAAAKPTSTTSATSTTGTTGTTGESGNTGATGDTSTPRPP